MALSCVGVKGRIFLCEDPSGRYSFSSVHSICQDESYCKNVDEKDKMREKSVV